MTSLVTGAGGFIGGHLARALLERGEDVRCADIKPRPEWIQVHPGAENMGLTDLQDYHSALDAASGCSTVYHLAAEAGGMGFISSHKASCTMSVLADVQVTRAARANGARIYYASSACVYPLSLQQAADAPDLAEHMDHPADPEEAYGWEKLFAEKMLAAHAADGGMTVRIGRYQSVYGPRGVWRGGREKAPTAVCRKIAEAKLSGAREIDIWGDGTAIRTFTYIDDAVAGTLAVTACDYGGPLNIGAGETLSIAELTAVVGEIAGWPVTTVTVPGPVGVPGRRGCDTSLAWEKAGWKAQVPVLTGLERTFQWVYDQVRAGR